MNKEIEEATREKARIEAAMRELGDVVARALEEEKRAGDDQQVQQDTAKEEASTVVQ